MDKDIYLIRHTTPDVKKGVCYGFSDVGVATTYPTEIEIVKKKIAEISFDVFYSSPLLRCKKLAEDIYTRSILFDDRIKELNFGEMEMIAYDQMDQAWLQHWMSDFVNICCPGGESFAELENRVIEFYKELLQKESKVIGIATHGGVIRSLICSILEIPLKNAFKVVFDWGSISKIEIRNHLAKVKYTNL